MPYDRSANWTFFSNHAHVLFCLVQNPTLTLRDVASKVGITERAVQGIVADLANAGVLERTRDGRRNRYQFHLDHPLRHPLESHRSVGELIDAVANGASRERVSPG